MTVAYYHQLALDWGFESADNRRFKIISVSSVVIMLALGLMLSSIPVPPEPRKARQEIPPRIAEVMLDRKRVQPKPKPKPKPKVVKPKPKPKPKPKKEVEVKVKKPVQKKAVKPLTKTQKKAREKAKESGLLALSDQLSGLIETDDIASMVGGDLKKGSSGSGSSSLSGDKGMDKVLADAGSGSGGVASGSVKTRVGSTKLSKLQVAAVKSGLRSVEQETVSSKRAGKKAASSSKGSGKATRGDEELSLVFDQKKSVLDRLYTRARRKNPGIKGKIIFKLTIAPSGEVTKLVIVSSALNDKDLEAKLMRRIKQFKFGAKNVEPVTVIYPIEFLPS